MTHEQVLEVVARRGLAYLLPAAVSDPDDLSCRQHDLEGHDQVAGVTEAGAQQREATACDPPAHQGARVRRGRVWVEHAVLLQLLVEFEHADAGSYGDSPIGQVDLMDLIHALDVDQDPAAKRDGSVVETSPAGTRDDGDFGAVGQFDDLRHLLCGSWQHYDRWHVLCPPVHREGRGHTCAIGPARYPG